MAQPKFDVAVRVQFLPEQSRPPEGPFAFAYTVTVKNTGDVAAQLVARHWVITDADGRVEEVRGLAVVGKQPVLKPGEGFEYTSWTRIGTPHGQMRGTFFCMTEQAHAFDAPVPAFELVYPGPVALTKLHRRRMSAPAWDFTALVIAADPRAPLAERHLWLVRLMQWLRHAPKAAREDGLPVPEPKTPRPLLRLAHLLDRLDAEPAFRERVRGLMRAFWAEVDAASLFADFGFPARQSVLGELAARVQAHWLPGTPDTADLAALFPMLAVADDAAWLEALDEPTLARIAGVLDIPHWRDALLDALTILASAVHAAGYAPALRQRMDAALLADEPFRRLAGAAARVQDAVHEGRHDDALREATFLRALLDACRRAADSVTAHLERFGISADIVFQLDQLHARTERIERLLDCVIAPAPAAEWRALLAALARAVAEQQGVRSLLARNYSLLARRVAERNAETGAHYITSSRAEYRDMLRRAGGGGIVIAGAVFVKFALAALALTAFWSGFWSGVNYAASFIVVMLLHWTVATKQPAMTAPSMAASLPRFGADAEGRADDGAEVEAFVDRVAQLTRSQTAGILGNVALCAPVVLAVQWLWATAFGQPLVGVQQAPYVLASLTLLGPTALFAAFTGVLLFASSLIAGYAENWFVFHRLDSALEWNPRIVDALGAAARARRWAAWWRANVSGVAANVSLGFLLGLVPVLLEFFAVPLDVRHVTLATGQLAAAVGALGSESLSLPAVWWCIAGIAVTGVLNVTVSFFLAFKLALRARGVRLVERRRIRGAIWRRFKRAPLSFFWPPREGRPIG